MSSSIEKLLAKITEKEKKLLGNIVEKIIENNFKGLDVKKLAGQEDVFRVRKGNFRIIFRITKMDVKIISIERRTDTTYRF